MRFDLHLHTTASDGHLTASALVEAAARAGLDAIAVTDHDSVDAIAPALYAADSLRASGGPDLLVIPGVELSAAVDGRDVHVLGYFIDHTDGVLRSRLETLRTARLDRARSMVEALREAGYAVTIDEVLELAEGGAVGRSHVARALVERGHIASVAQAFEELIGRGQPYYVPKPAISPSEVVRIVRDAGGIPVLAHPGVTGIDDLVPALVADGLAGLEAYHAEHSPERRARYAAWAADLGLLVTGGSDFHGATAPGAGIGTVEIPDSVLADLLAARDTR